MTLQVSDQFWSAYEPTSTLHRLINGDEKEQLAKSGEPFEISAVRAVAHPEYGERWYLDLRFASGEEATMPLGRGQVYTRDELLQAMQGYLANHPDTTVRAQLVQQGRVYLIQPADTKNARRAG